ncbi:alpha/beta hydrolase [Bacillus timonensis]|nr:alpha/beta hydrolase [Bacillus timonensis]
MMEIHVKNHYKMNVLGVDVHYQLYPLDNKPVIVLIHGFLSSSFSFRKLIPLLSNDFTVLAVDLPPFGKSEKSVRFQYSYQNMARVVIELITKLGYKDVVLVGHSMGGQISLNVEKQRPDLVSKTILLCSSGYMSRMSTTLMYATYIPFFHLYVKYHLAKQGILHNLKNVVFDHSMIDEDMINGYTEPFYDRQIFRALTRMIRDREGDLPVSDLQKIATPSLLIWGEEDRVVPVEVGKRLQKDIPNSTLHIMKKTGHLVPEEQPRRVYEHIGNFVTN